MAFSGEQLSRYSRQFVLKEIGVSGQKKLLESKVLVIGAGALGSSALMYLTAAGVGTIGIADCDRVELSNLQRQIVHSTGTVGTEKTFSARQKLEELNPDVSFRLYSQRITADNIMEVIESFDFIIDATDRFESKFLINDACVLAKKAYSHAGAVRFGGQTMTYVPGQGPCLRCLLGDVPSPEQSATCSQAGVLGAVTGVLGSIQAAETIKFLVGAGRLLTGRVLSFDALRMNFQTVEIPGASPDCRICGKHPSILSLADSRKEYEPACCGTAAAPLSGEMK
ncbi:MAG: HesA/MoeB/ThiF family protein [Emergencia sp.]